MLTFCAVCPLPGRLLCVHGLRVFLVGSRRSPMQASFCRQSFFMCCARLRRLLRAATLVCALVECCVCADGVALLLLAAGLSYGGGVLVFLWYGQGGDRGRGSGGGGRKPVAGMRAVVDVGWRRRRWPRQQLRWLCLCWQRGGQRRACWWRRWWQQSCASGRLGDGSPRRCRHLGCFVGRGLLVESWCGRRIAVAAAGDGSDGDRLGGTAEGVFLGACRRRSAGTGQPGGCRARQGAAAASF